MTRISLFLIFLSFSLKALNADRSFTIDYPNNQFLKDGKPFRYASGSLHYFRVPSVLWRDRMLKYKAAGLNAIQTYVEWNSHEPEKGVYDFTGNNDLIGFLKTANDVGLVVILRAGPFMDAERDMGGLPYWLLRINPKMQLRTSDPTYLTQVDEWYSVLLPKLVPMLYENGGPIITVQVENEYGSYGCDFVYTTHLRDLFKQYLGTNVVLFTTDGNGDGNLECGKIDNVFSTVDFGPGSDPAASFQTQHRHQEFGPNVNSEYYPGWLDHWENPHSMVSSAIVCKTLDKMLSLNASVNVYMFHGGTSFGFGAGSNMDGSTFDPCPTSYDYDAPLNEAGDPTQKYYDMRKVIGKYLPLPNVPVPVPSPKMQLLPIQMTPVASLFDKTMYEDPIWSIYPLSFEQLKHNHGFVLYSTNITVRPSDPAILTIKGLADRAQVYVDSNYQGTLSRTHQMFQMPIKAKLGSRLDIFVENQGRVCFGSQIGELKGITSNVTLGPAVLMNWNQYRFFANWDHSINEIQNKIQLIKYDLPIQKVEKIQKMQKIQVPTYYTAQFVLPNDPQLPLDTFLRLDGWNKGLAFLNNFNLGRYWPIAGPQITLYAPANLFNPYPLKNNITIFELEESPCDLNGQCYVQFVRTHVINGTTPYSGVYFKKSKLFHH